MTEIGFLALAAIVVFLVLMATTHAASAPPPGPGGREVAVRAAVKCHSSH